MKEAIMIPNIKRLKGMPASNLFGQDIFPEEHISKKICTAIAAPKPP